jgi:hypothetical protein
MNNHAVYTPTGNPMWGHPAQQYTPNMFVAPQMVMPQVQSTYPLHSLPPEGKPSLPKVPVTTNGPMGLTPPSSVSSSKESFSSIALDKALPSAHEFGDLTLPSIKRMYSQLSAPGVLPSLAFDSYADPYSPLSLDSPLMLTPPQSRSAQLSTSAPIGALASLPSFFDTSTISTQPFTNFSHGSKDGNRELLSAPVSPRSQPSTMTKSPIKKKYSYAKDKARYFPKTHISKEFIMKHITLNQEKYNIDTNREINQVKITEDDILGWLVVEFLVTDLKLYDRRRDPTPLIHHFPENRFDIDIQFQLNRGCSNKEVDLKLALLKPPNSQLDEETIAEELGRLLNENFIYHCKTYLGQKKKRLRAKPQWGLGSDNELIIIELNLNVTTL